MRQTRRAVAACAALTASTVAAAVWIQGRETSVLPLPTRGGRTAVEAVPSGRLEAPGFAHERAQAPALALASGTGGALATARGPWRVVDGVVPELPGLIPGFVREARRVELDRAGISELEIGSLVPLDLPDGQHLLARVETLELSEDGDRGWSGHVEGYGNRYPVVFTQGDEACFGTIATPTGLYGLEARGDEAVLFRDEREGLQDPSRECFLLPG